MKLRYALVGTGSRGLMFKQALTATYADRAELLAVCDPNPARAAHWLSPDHGHLPVYAPADFETMIRDHGVNVVVVTSMDRTHHTYICRAMEAGCDVISEKPLTIDAEKCRQIIETRQRTGKKLTVTFNYRYAPRNARVREVLASGIIGQVNSVHFEWLLDTKHGADYFRRWHRDKRNSGGLLVHKSTHHFDLLNWWMQTRPETVFAMGDLRFYGKENAEARGYSAPFARARGSEAAKSDPFALHLDRDPNLKGLYADAEHVDAYYRDQNVFSDGINIEDDLGVMVRYQNKAVLTYHLTAYAPWEGYRVMFNGSKGRLEFEVIESPYVSASEDDHNFARNVKGQELGYVEEPVTLRFCPHWGPPQVLDVPPAGGGHGGADPRMLAHIFEPTEPDPLGQRAGLDDGIWSILTGIAGNQSLRTGLPVTVADLLR